MEKITEKSAFKSSGYLMVFILMAATALEVYYIHLMVVDRDSTLLWIIIPLALIISISVNGFTVIQPNESKVLIMFGKYTGTVAQSGFWFVNPFTVKRNISLRIRNFNSDKIKVNDHDGNPIELAAVIVWKVINSARAVFDVENFEQFVSIQSETAIRALASQFPYDSSEENEESLKGNPQKIAEHLRTQVQERLEIAGVEVIESRLSYLAYAQEIAQVMLRRQQAQAIVAARLKIVEGAVGMVESALNALSEKKIIELDEEKKATMVNNLMVALVADREAQPVINTGTLYQ